MVHAEELAHGLVRRWLLWLRAVGAETPPAIRIDFLVRRVSPGRAELHTLELTEAGFSLLGWRGGPAAVMGALLDACFDDTGPTQDEQSLLRAFHARQPADGAADAEATHTRFVDNCGGCDAGRVCADGTPAPEVYDSDDAESLRRPAESSERGRGRGSRGRGGR